MTITSRVCTLTMSGATGSRTFQATADVQDTPAGKALNITITNGTTGLTPPAAADTLTLDVFIDNSSTNVKSFTLTPNTASQSVTFYLTSDGNSGSSARCGFLRMRLRATKTTGGPTNTYDINTEPSTYGSPANTAQTAFSVTVTDPAYIRGVTTGVTTLNSSAYGYGDTITATTTLGAAPYSSRTVNVKLGALAAVGSAASTTAVFTTAQGVADNRFAAANSSLSTVTTIPNANLVAVPWTQLYTPDDVSGLQLWLRGSDLTTGAISSWADQSGNGRNAAQATPSKQPSVDVAGVGGYSAAQFDGSGKYLAVANASGLNPTAGITAFVVIKPTSWAGGNRRIFQKGSGDDQYGMVSDGSTYLTMQLNGTAWCTSSTIPPAGAISVLMGNYNSATPAALLTLNGTSIATTATGGSLATTTSELDIGHKPGSSVNGDSFNGDIAELLIFNRALNTNEQALVTRYLGQKYGVAVTA